jgi:hypothetical protein
MAKLYTKNTWADEVLAAAERYNVLEDDGSAFKANMQIALATAVVQAGTAADAARMNNLENGVDALDTLLDTVNTNQTNLLTGWIAAGVTWTRTGVNTFTAPGNVVSLFPVGTKCKCVNVTAKQFYVVAAAYTSLTTVTVAGDDLEAGAITSPYYSYATNPQGFLHWFNVTCAMSGAGGTAGTYAETSTYSRFAMQGKTVFWTLRKQLTNLGSWSGNVQITYPVPRSAATSPVFGGGYVYANSAAVASPKAILGKASGASAQFYKTALGNLLWADLAINDWILIDCQYEAA